MKVASLSALLPRIVAASWRETDMFSTVDATFEILRGYDMGGVLEPVIFVSYVRYYLLAGT